MCSQGIRNVPVTSALFITLVQMVGACCWTALRVLRGSPSSEVRMNSLTQRLGVRPPTTSILGHIFLIYQMVRLTDQGILVWPEEKLLLVRHSFFEITAKSSHLQAFLLRKDKIRIRFHTAGSPPPGYT